MLGGSEQRLAMESEQDLIKVNPRTREKASLQLLYVGVLEPFLPGTCHLDQKTFFLQYETTTSPR